MDEPKGALSQVSPAAAMATTASGGNPMLSQMLQSMLQQNQDRQSYMQQQKEAYTRDLEKYAAQIQQQQEQGDPSADWGAMANAASSVAPTWGNIGAMLARVGGAYGAAQSEERNRGLQMQAELVKRRQDEVRALESASQNAAMLRALSGGAKTAAPTIKVVDGKLVAAKYNPETGEFDTEVLTGSQDQIKARMYQNFFNKAVANEVPNPEAYAQAQVERTLAEFGGTTVKGEANAIPGVRSTTPAAPSLQVTVGEQQRRDAEARRIREGEQNGQLPPWPKMPEEAAPQPEDTQLSPEDAATATRLMARIKANPAAAEKDTATLNAMMKKYETPAPAMTYIDKPKRKMEEATATEAGKALGAEQQDLNAAAASSSQMIGQLDLLKRLYLTPNMPEGRFANELQTVRSGLKTIGIDVGDEVGAADMASSIAGKMALLTRTADGKNLMPGAMSDFEQRLLRTLVPGLEGTAQGRAALIDVMQQMARSRMRFAEEANKMAETNRGILPTEWNARKQRIMKEEMARLAHLNAEVAARFQGAK